MANYNSLKSAIEEVIRTNGNNEITGALLQQTLLAIVNALGVGYQYAGLAVPATNPGTPDQNVFYLCGAGTYTNMGGLTVPVGAIGLLKYNGTWTADTVDVGKNYDGYLGITNGPAISASGTQSAYIDENGNIVPQSNFTTKSFAVTPGKSYYVSGLEKGNAGTCGWAVYSGATKMTYGANNISTNDTVVRIPEGATILYVCQPNYGNLPAIEVRETDSIIEQILAQLNREETAGNGPDLDIANYALLVETYVNKIWNNGQLIDDALNERNATSLVKIDKTKPIIPGTEGNTDVVFFDANQNYISTVQAYIWEPIAAADIPATAVFVAFNYFRNAQNMAAADGVFYVTTRPDFTRLTKKLYATQNKIKGTRPKVQIYTTDTQETIFKKMVDAIYIEDCDVVFEKGAYTLNSIFYLMRSKYEWSDAFELPVGGNCHYYLNNSTITGNYAGQSPSANLVVESNSSIFGTHRLDGQTYRIMDGELVADGLVYCVHDEASGGAGAYVHHYENLIMRYKTGQYTQSGLSKCIGGGTGLAGEVVLNGCKFYNANTTQDVSWHGHNLSTASVFKLFIANSFFVNGIGLHQLAANETGYLFLSASLVPAVPSGDGWTVFSTI